MSYRTKISNVVIVCLSPWPFARTVLGRSWRTGQAMHLLRGNTRITLRKLDNILTYKYKYKVYIDVNVYIFYRERSISQALQQSVDNVVILGSHSRRKSPGDGA